MTKELVVLSGKGGTGKTSLTACLARLAGGAVLVDADVDASNLPLLLGPDPKHREDFISGETACLDLSRCERCGVCATACRFGALTEDPSGGPPRLDTTACSGCGVCLRVCPRDAFTLVPRRAGQWHASRTAFGPLLFAELEPGQGHSGKLVSLLKETARGLAEKSGYERILVDGPPGVGCPVHAALSGADRLLLVAEPGVSSLHDAERVLGLADHFGVAACLCVNKWDLDPDGAEKLESMARSQGVLVMGRIRYDPAFQDAIHHGRDLLVEDPTRPAAAEVTALWNSLEPFV